MSANTSDPIRVVVAAVGAITSQGTGADALWEGVKAGRVAIRPVQRLPMEGYRTLIGGEVQEMVLPKHEYRHPEAFRERVIDFALKAAEEAHAAAGDGVKQIPPERWGLVIGTCNTGMLSGERWYSDHVTGQTVDPELVVMVPPQALAEAVAGAFGSRGRSSRSTPPAPRARTRSVTRPS
jgi:3-oxoacyl-[acyl-carrier-protein] synthase II